jgi:hypothetical protein
LTEETATILSRGPGYAVATWENVLIGCWRIQSNVTVITELGAGAAILNRKYPGGFSNLHVIWDDPPLPGADTRKLLQRQLNDYATPLACLGVVLEGTGFWASAVRSFVIGLRILAPRSFEMNITGSIQDLVTWAVPIHNAATAHPVAVAALTKVLSALRAEVNADAVPLRGTA